MSEQNDKLIDPDSPGFLISDIARLSRASFAKEIERAALPVTLSEARVLVHMARCGAIRQHRLAELLGVAPMSVTGFLDRLEKAGLIERQPDPTDRRAKIAALTAAARPILTQIADAGRRSNTVAQAGISDADWAHFREVALKLRSNLDQARSETLNKEAAA